MNCSISVVDSTTVFFCRWQACWRFGPAPVTDAGLWGWTGRIWDGGWYCLD